MALLRGGEIRKRRDLSFVALIINYNLSYKTTCKLREFSQRHYFIVQQGSYNTEPKRGLSKTYLLASAPPTAASACVKTFT